MTVLVYGKRSYSGRQTVVRTLSRLLQEHPPTLTLMTTDRPGVDEFATAWARTTPGVILSPYPEGVYRALTDRPDLVLIFGSGCLRVVNMAFRAGLPVTIVR